MNAFERVMNILQGRPVDRPPVFANLGAYAGLVAGIPLKTLYDDAAAYVAGQRAVQSAFGFDLVLSPFEYSSIAEAFGGTTVYFDNQPPNVKRPAVRDAAAALALPLPDPDRSGRLPVILEATRLLAAEFHGRTPVFAAVPGPCSLPALMMGMEGWLETSLFDEPMARALRERSGVFFVDWCNHLFEAGADGVVITEGFLAAEIAPRERFEGEWLAHLRAMMEQMKGPAVVHHAGGRINPVIDLIVGLPSLLGISIGARDDPAEARRIVGPALPLIGNLDNLRLPGASADDVRAECLNLLRAAVPAGPFILANSGGDIPLDTPPENLRAMLEASARYAAESPLFNKGGGGPG